MTNDTWISKSGKTPNWYGLDSISLIANMIDGMLGE